MNLSFLSLRIALPFALLLALLAGPAAGADVRIGVLAPLGSDEAMRDWAPVAEVLNRELPEHRFRLVESDLPGLSLAVREGTVEFVITNSGHFVAMEREFGLTRIATLERPGVPSPARALGSAVIALKTRRDLRDFADLRGRRIAAVSRDAFGGFQVAQRELLRQGVPLDAAGAVLEVGYPMQKVVDALREGRADAGVVKACLLEQMVAEGGAGRDEFKVLSPMAQSDFPCRVSTALYPDWPFAALRHTPYALSKQVAAVLLAYRPAPGVPGWTIPIDDQPVHEMMEDLRIGPYSYLKVWSLEGMWRRYWPWVLGAAVLLAGWVVHAVRVEHLVRVRTGELRAALAARDRSEAEARAQRDKMEHLSRLSILGEMSGSIAHELNQPLAAIGNFAQGMARRIAGGRPDPEPLAGGCAEIAGQADLAGGILRRIREFSRKRPTERVAADLAQVVGDAVALFRGMQLEAPPVTLSGFERPAPVWADVLQLEQVLLNLLKNSLDALREVPADARRIAVALDEVDGYWQVSVADNGQGLADKDLPRLFQSFFSTKADGMGLGLSISQSIVEAHGGRIFARRNAPSPGLSVAFTLPKAAP